MKFLSRPRFVLAIVLASAIGAAGAQEQPSPAEREPGKGVLRLLPADSVTEHSIETPRGKLAYTATAGTLAFYNQSGDQSASAFYTAYVAKNSTPNRPLTFVFNGGPGAASAFLHLGLVGPRILDFGPDDHDATRADLRDNPDTWLVFTDLVLIDPIGTGWSRTIKAEDGKHFWNVRADANAMEWVGAWLGHTAPPAGKVGFMYMLEGGTDASNTDPYATQPTAENHWVNTGPHIMIVGAASQMLGYPRSPDPDTSKPYVMWPGTPYEHLMVPVK